MSILNKLYRRLRRQEGAYTIEFLAIMIVLLLVIIIIVQVSLALLQGIMFNHALSLAAQQAAARGGVDRGAVQVFTSHLPPGMRLDPASVPTGSDPSGLTAYKMVGGSRQDIPVVEYGGNGREQTTFGEIFCVQASYKPITSGGFFSDHPITRTIPVSSQSSREATTNEVNGPCS